MPIYVYECRYCGFLFEMIGKVTKKSFRDEKPVHCLKCNSLKAFKLPSRFKQGKYILDTSKLSGYDTDELTLGKLIDEGGIPYEFKDGLRKREKRIEDTKQYIREVKVRGKKYGFDPFSVDDKELDV